MTRWKEEESWSREEKKVHETENVANYTPLCATPTCYFLLDRQMFIYAFSTSTRVRKEEKKTFLVCRKWNVWTSKRVNEEGAHLKLCYRVLCFLKTHGDVIWYAGRKSRDTVGKGTRLFRWHFCTHQLFFPSHVLSALNKNNQFAVYFRLLLFKTKWMDYVYDKEVVKLKAKCWNQISIIISLMRHKISSDFNVRDKYIESYKFNFAIVLCSHVWMFQLRKRNLCEHKIIRNQQSWTIFLCKWTRMNVEDEKQDRKFLFFS